MSELYLTLRSRLWEVQDWVEIPSEVLTAARKRVGGRETVARMLSISSKTLERYEKEGRVPRAMLAAFARVLSLQIEAPELEPLTVQMPGWNMDGHLVVVLERLADSIDLLARVSERVDRIEKERAEIGPKLTGWIEDLQSRVAELEDTQRGSGPAKKSQSA